MLLKILFIRKCWSIDSYWALSQQETTSINQTLTKKLRSKMFSRFQKPLHLAGRHFSTTGGRNKTVAVMGASGGKRILISNNYWWTKYLYCNVINYNTVHCYFLFCVGIGQPLSMLLKLNPAVTKLNLYDIVHTPGVASDLSHCETASTSTGFVGMFLFPTIIFSESYIICPLDSPL